MAIAPDARMSSEGRRGRGLAWCACALGYLLLGVAATWPVVRHLGSYAVGGIQDIWATMWSNWWFVEALTHRHANPFFCPLVWYPFGMDMHLLEIHIVPAVLFLVTEPWLGLVASYNVVMILGIAASGLGMHVLAYHLTRDHLSSFVGGLAFCLSSYMVGTVASGWVHLAHAEWLPLYVWALLRMTERPTLARGAACGGLLCLAANTSWYYGIYLMLYSVLFGAYKLATARRDVLNWALVRALAALGVVFLAGTAPVAWPTMAKMASGGIVPKLAIPDIPAGVVDFFVPLYEHMMERVPDFAYSTTFVGYVTLALAVVGALRARSHGWRPGWWLWVAGVAFALGLGPHLNLVSGEELLIGGRPVPLPDMVVRAVMPFYRFCRNQWRHQAMLCVAASVLVSFGAAHLLGCCKGRVRWLAWLGMGLLLVGEALWVLPVPFPAPMSSAYVPRVYERLAKHPDSRAIIVSPLSYKALYYQTYHHRPIVGYTSRKKRLPPEQVRITQHLFAAAERVIQWRLYRRGTGCDGPEALLRSKGVGYIVIHEPGADQLIEIR